MRTYLADRAGVNPVREFFLLRGGSAWTCRARSRSGLPMEARGLLQPHVAADYDARGEGERNRLLRFSLAGMQLKFSAVEEPPGRSDHSGHGNRRFVDSQAAVS